MDLVQKRQYRAEKVAWFLQAVPFIRFIGLTGSLAYDVARANSDIDIFVIAKHGRIWTCRFFVIMVLRMLKIYRTGDTVAERAGKICPNRFVTDDYLLINPQNRYHAQDYTQMVPLYDSSVYKKFLRQNDWMEKYGYFPPKKALTLVKSGNILSSIRIISEWVLAGAIGGWLERHVRKYQLRRFQKLPKFGEKGSGVFADDKEIRIHPKPR